MTTERLGDEMFFEMDIWVTAIGRLVVKNESLISSYGFNVVYCAVMLYRLNDRRRKPYCGIRKSHTTKAQL